MTEHHSAALRSACNDVIRHQAEQAADRTGAAR